MAGSTVPGDQDTGPVPDTGPWPGDHDIGPVPGPWPGDQDIGIGTGDQVKFWLSAQEHLGNFNNNA